MKCRQPGCSGTIVDGYCDICGMPPSASTSQASSPAESPRPRASQAPPVAGPGSVGDPRLRQAASRGGKPGEVVTPPPRDPRLARTQPPAARRTEGATLGKRGGRCPQPGCPGTVIDGYCNYCGNPPDAKPAAPTPQLLGTTLSTTATAAELGTVLMGSALVGLNSGRQPVRS
ncbi:MAG: hypothetical protein GX454_05065, partial [Brooklawnia sp.]|nr:hypothetical protein [Brooklawnia sp.]